MPKMAGLHNHSEYSPLDGACTIEEMILRAKELDLAAISITDHGTNIGHREFLRKGKEHDVKVILGEELYYAETDRFDRRSKAARSDGTSIYVHLIALAQNDKGLKNLYALDQEAWQSHHHKPRMDFELLEQHNEGIIFTSGCRGGLISKAFEREDEAYAYEQASKFKELLGDRYYIELQSHNPVELNHKLLNLADKLDIKPVLSEDSHHAWPHQKEFQEIFLVLSCKPDKNPDADPLLAQKMPIMERLNYLYPDRRMSFQEFDIFIAGYDHRKAEMLAQGIDREDLFINSLEIADRIEDYTYIENEQTLPDLANDVEKTLREKVYAGLSKLGLDDKPEYIERVEYELGVIIDKKFPNYFLMIEDLVAWIKENKIRMGLGRGSAPGSLVSYSLGITGLDPIEKNLLFERFLDPERPDWPDVDIDIQKSRREEVKQYLTDKYGHVAGITNILRYGGKKAIKDAARALGVPYKEVSQVMKVLKGVEEATGADAIARFEKSSQTVDFRKKYPDVIPIAKRLKGMVSGYGIHASGVVVANKSLTQYGPLETRKVEGSDERVAVVGLDYRDCETTGLIKIDLLGLATLDVIDDSIKFIQDGKNVYIDIDKLAFTDKKVYEMISTGKTLGVFQFEQPASAKLCARLKPKNFDDLVATNALVRPGAWDAIGEEYLKVKSGKKKMEVIHPDVSYFMDSTYHLPLFQEQLMKLCIDLADMTVAESNKVRKGVGKKIRSIIDEFKPKFVTGSSIKIKENKAEKLWLSFEAAGAYMFNTAHSTAYSILSYQTAWLKVNYPEEFMCATLKHAEDSSMITDYLLDCKNNGIVVKLPHVNESDIQFSVDRAGGLRMGLADVKYISEVLAKRIINYRPYADYKAFRDKVTEKGSGLNVRVLQSLNKFGGAAFDDNPRPVDYKDHLYDILNIPAFQTNMITTMMKEHIIPMIEYSDIETFFVMAMVKNVKRGDGWARVDMVDSTGSTGAFVNVDTDIQKGKMYVFLISNNRIAKHVDLSDPAASEDIIMDFLRRPTLEEIGEGQHKILHAEARKTKAGDNMAYMVISNRDKELETVMVFKDMFGMVRATCPIGAVKTLKLSELRNGGYCVNGVS